MHRGNGTTAEVLAGWRVSAKPRNNRRRVSAARNPQLHERFHFARRGNDSRYSAADFRTCLLQISASESAKVGPARMLQSRQSGKLPEDTLPLLRKAERSSIFGVSLCASFLVGVSE